MEDSNYSVSLMSTDPILPYRNKRDAARRAVQSKYTILGFISSGTYGRVYKAQSRDDDEGLSGKKRKTKLYAIKKFKPDKEGEAGNYTGISQSAIREIALNREISHENVTALKEVILEEKSIYMVFEYAEHDFLQVIHHYSQTWRKNVPLQMLKSLTYQLLNGLLYLHSCHILHRDLKPANILITSRGVVKIGDLGLARVIYQPLQPFVAGDKVVVTIWYRAPELLMGAKHYTKAIDCWAVGCVLGELASLKPLFKGEEAKLDSKKNVPFQKDQLIKIFEVLGTPDESDWPGLRNMPEYHNMKRLDTFHNCLQSYFMGSGGKKLGELAHSDSAQTSHDFMKQLFAYDPEKRLTAKEALNHQWFQDEPKPTLNAFEGQDTKQIPPHRRITQDDAPSMLVHPSQAQLAQQFQPSGKAGAASSASFASMTQSGGGQGQYGIASGSRKKARLG